MARTQSRRFVCVQARQGGRKQQSTSEYLAFAVVASISLTAALLTGRRIDLRAYVASTDGARPLEMDRSGGPLDANVQQQQQQQQQQQGHEPAALARQQAAAAAVSAAGVQLQRYHQLHIQPVLATHNEAGNYSEIHWPQYGRQQLPLPRDAELQLSSSSRANGFNPYMLVAYNGTFFGKQWPTHV
jgi:hypothetical protein